MIKEEYVLHYSLPEKHTSTIMLGGLHPGLTTWGDIVVILDKTPETQMLYNNSLSIQKFDYKNSEFKLIGAFISEAFDLKEIFVLKIKYDYAVIYGK